MAPPQQLTSKQLRALANASPQSQQQLQASFSRQYALANKGWQPRREWWKEASSQTVVRRAPRKRQQRERQPARSGKHVTKVPRALGYAFDAFDHRHLPLDEVTAPYACTNFVSVLEFTSAVDMDKICVVSPRVYSSGGFALQPQFPGPLTDVIAMLYDANESIDAAIPILEFLRCPIAGRLSRPAAGQNAKHTTVRARLHNMSVSLECLGTNTGLYPPGSAYIGSVPNIETGPTTGDANTKLKAAWAVDSIEVGYLRSTPAASLVDNPVQVNSAIAESISYKSWRDIVVMASGHDLGSMAFSNCVEPIVVYVPRCGSGDTVVQYRLNIGQQWCSRHPTDVLLRATQKQYPPTPPGLWHTAVSAIKDIGPKLLDRAASAAVDTLAAGIQRIGAPSAP